MVELFLITLLASLGFANAYFLHWQYQRYLKTSQKMYCLVGEDCAKVVSSPYGTTLGVKNEILGLYYYGLVLVLTVLALGWPVVSYLGTVYLVISSLVAAVFSFYLLFVQTRILKTLCSWCLIAIAINGLIFVTSVIFLVGLWNSVS